MIAPGYFMVSRYLVISANACTGVYAWLGESSITRSKVRPGSWQRPILNLEGEHFAMYSIGNSSLSTSDSSMSESSCTSIDNFSADGRPHQFRSLRKMVLFRLVVCLSSSSFLLKSKKYTLVRMPSDLKTEIAFSLHSSAPESSMSMMMDTDLISLSGCSPVGFVLIAFLRYLLLNMFFMKPSISLRFLPRQCLRSLLSARGFLLWLLSILGYQSSCR